MNDTIVKDPFYHCINLQTLDETEWTHPGYFDFEDMTMLDTDENGDPDRWTMLTQLGGIEPYVIKGTEAHQTNGIYTPDTLTDTAELIRLLSRDLIDEDWENINFRLTYWTRPAPADGDSRIGWSILLTDLNDGGVTRMLENVYDAVESDYSGLAEDLFDVLADNVGDVARVRDLYVQVLARQFHFDHLPQEALDMIRNHGMNEYAREDGCFSEAMYDAFADSARFLKLATGKDFD